MPANAAHLALFPACCGTAAGGNLPAVLVIVCLLLLIPITLRVHGCSGSAAIAAALWILAVNTVVAAAVVIAARLWAQAALLRKVDGLHARCDAADALSICSRKSMSKPWASTKWQSIRCSTTA